MKQQCLSLPLTPTQEQSLKELSNNIEADFNHGLAAVRPSAIEGDGNEQSYA